MRRVLVSIAIVLSFTAISLSAQDLPSPQEMERILIEGPDWKAYKIKYQILDKQSKVDSTSIDYQLCNLFLWSIYQKLEDKESENKVTQSLYSFLKSGGYDRLQGFIIANYPEEISITQQGNIALIMEQHSCPLKIS